MANKEDMNAVIRPTIKGKKLNVENTFKEDINSTIAARDCACPKKRELQHHLFANQIQGHRR